jgi:fatty-acyl-CoA synthase
VLPYADLRKRVRSIALQLLELGLERGARVALIAITGPDFMLVFFACQYAGLVPVPLPATMFLGGRQAFEAQLRRLVQDCKASAAMAPADYLPFLREAVSDEDLLFVGCIDELPAAQSTEDCLQPSASDEVAYLQYTSGSTRYPRGVIITQKAVMHNLAAIVRHGVQIREGDRCCSWLPYYHDMGLVGMVLAPMASQLSVDYLETRDFAMRPRLWLDLMSRNRATISFSPPFGYELCSHRLRDQACDIYDLSAWRVAGVGAEIIRPEALSRFAEIMRASGFERRAFVPCYGMAECSLAVTFAELGKGYAIDAVDADGFADGRRAAPAEFGAQAGRIREFVVCGRPLPGFEVEIRDADGQPLPERCCGTLFVRGDSVMSGYLGQEEESRRVLSADGWLNTGDLAYRVGENLVITGREKDLIIINGRNIWPQDLEFIAEQQPEVRPGDSSAFAITGSDGWEKAVLVVQCRKLDQPTQADLAQRLHAKVREELGIECLVELVPRNTLPRTTSGKLSRSGARNGFLERHPVARLGVSETLFSFPEIDSQAV